MHKNELIIKNIKFQGTELLAIQENKTGKIYTGINFVLRGLGFDERQIEYRRNKWNEDKVISKGVQKFSYPSDNGGEQEAYCIDIKKLPLALAKIDITPKMQKEMPYLVERLEIYQERCADVLADEFIIKKDSASKPKKKNLSSVNMTARILQGIYKDAGVDPLHIAVAVDHLYKTEAGIDFGIPLISDVPELWDYTGMAKELGVLSAQGNPHDKAISGIIQNFTLPDKYIVKTPYSKNGHDGITVQYTKEVFEMVKDWLTENQYPETIPYVQSNGKTVLCKVFYQVVTVA